MTFKHRRRVDTAMSANTATPMFLTSCEADMHIWKYGGESINLFKSSYFVCKSEVSKAMPSA